MLRKIIDENKAISSENSIRKNAPNFKKKESSFAACCVFIPMLFVIFVLLFTFSVVLDGFNTLPPCIPVAKVYYLVIWVVLIIFSWTSVVQVIL